MIDFAKRRRRKDCTFAEATGWLLNLNGCFFYEETEDGLLVWSALKKYDHYILRSFSNEQPQR